MEEKDVETAVKRGYLNKVKNQLYGLLCEREKDGEWEKFIDTLYIELLGFPEESKSIYYYKLCYKVSSLKYLRYDYFRKTIFESMNLIDNIGD